MSLKKRRSRKPSGVFLQDHDSTTAVRRKLSRAEQTFKRLNKLKKKLTAPKFLKELQAKEELYYFHPRLFKSQTGRRFDMEILHDPIFEAIRYCRERTFQTEVLELFKVHSEEEFSEAGIDPSLAKGFRLFAKSPPQNWIEPFDHKHEKLLAQEFVTAVKKGDIARLEELVQLCRIESRAANPPKETKSDSRRWHYYAAYAARDFLERGVLPDKEVVERMARINRLGDEFPLLRLPRDRWDEEWKVRKERLPRPTKRTWTRIFRDLGLGELPAGPTHPRSKDN